ncbi:uncharacterized protein DEA37_0004182 [Paragonimus westermani]|uniref:Uncharacterized protein n=1 Tax=Paragonimus westermani TaxID=34504 RepID=A0A5J4N9X5_9TREM|nr:uncharacterized protein DEA37_0004182 [Paragonimus westermani]
MIEKIISPFYYNTTFLLICHLKDILDSKNIAIKELQYELARVCKAHNDLIQACEGKMRQFGIPVEQLGFKPLKTTLCTQKLGISPAGLVSVPP